MWEITLDMPRNMCSTTQMQPAATLPAYHPHPMLNFVSMGDGGHALRLIYLIRSLIDHGRTLIATARQCALASDWAGLRAVVKPFGTLDLRLIVDRILAAVNRAALLQAGLERLHGFGCWSNSPGSPRPPTPTAPHAPGPRTQAAAQRGQDQAPSDQGPSDQGPGPAAVTRLAAELLRRPIDEVIAELCRDLGITPDHPLWQDLYRGIIAYGAGVAAMDR